MDKPQKILVPVDFSPHAETLITFAASYAKALDAKATFYHVVDERSFVTYNPVYAFPEYYPEMKLDSEIEKKIIASASEKFAKFIETMPLSGVSYDVCIDTGIPYVRICDKAACDGYDLIVIASHGKTNLKEIFLGSVVDYISHHSEVPVLICKLKGTR